MPPLGTACFRAHHAEEERSRIGWRRAQITAGNVLQQEILDCREISARRTPRSRKVGATTRALRELGTGWKGLNFALTLTTSGQGLTKVSLLIGCSAIL
jgi:hypothetical protein